MAGDWGPSTIRCVRAGGREGRVYPGGAVTRHAEEGALGVLDYPELQCVGTAVRGPAPSQVEEEVESQCLRQLSAALPGKQFVEAVNKFNSNVAYSGLNYAVTQDGLFVENKEKLINTALTALISKEGKLPWQQIPLLPNTVCPLRDRHDISGEHGGAGGSVPRAEATGGIQSWLPGLHYTAQVSCPTIDPLCTVPTPAPPPPSPPPAQHA